MNIEQAKFLVANLLDRISRDPRLQETVTQAEVDALQTLLEEPPPDAPPVANEHRPPVPHPDPESLLTGKPRETIPSTPSTHHASPIRLCLDFGTASSKAFAWNSDSDTPMPLRIGSAAGEPNSPYSLSSTIFISHDGLVFFGQAAIDRAAAVVDPQKHQHFQSIKDILTVGQQLTLLEPVSGQYNPSEQQVNHRDIIALYLAFLTDNALLALNDDHQHSRRDIPRSYTKPVFDQNRDEWATEILNECAAIGQVLADRFSGQWADGIHLSELKRTIAEADIPDENLVVRDRILPEPVAAFCSRMRSYTPREGTRRLLMVIDVGAGTTDFAMFVEVEKDDEVHLWPIKNSITTIRIAGDSIDNVLMEFLLQNAGVMEGHSRINALKADLRRDIRLVKERLFREGAVTRRLENDLSANVRREEFLKNPSMTLLHETMRKKFNEVLSNVHESWRTFDELHVFFTGGGAALPMVTELATGQPIVIGGRMITAIPVSRPPSWVEREPEDVLELYPQLAVSIGGACYGANRTPRLNLDRELREFGGDLPDAEWEIEVTR